jgi:predicted helicase
VTLPSIKAADARALTAEYRDRAGSLPCLGAILDLLRGMAERPISEGDAADFLALHLLAGPLVDTFLQGDPWLGLDPCRLTAKAVTAGGGFTRHLELLGPLYAFFAEVYSPADPFAARQDTFNIALQTLFKNTFPASQELHGVVFTPTILVDFTIHSVAKSFLEDHGREVHEPGVMFKDPFCGTGIFLARVLDLGLLDRNLLYKYVVDLSGQEINPYFWHVARLNVEFEFYKRSKGVYGHIPARGIRLMDTFMEGEADGPLTAGAAER